MKVKTVREMICENEHRVLSPNACFSDESRGRNRHEEECELRTCFQRDRDRVIHSNSFRRLKHKTQVFLSPQGDYYRTRLTHTLEVSQIARTIAIALGLNEALTEAIALGHDLGHTPFGHAGERALNSVCDGGFRHYEQSLRVADVIEKEGRGLNLTQEVRDGIERHTSGKEAFTLEGRIVRLADRIAYINHDIDDAVHACVLKETDIPEDIRETLGQNKSQRINKLVLSAVNNSKNDIILGEDCADAFATLHSFMFERVYTNPVCKGEEARAIEMIKWLYEYFLMNPDEMPSEYKTIREKEGVERAACDYIAGMTDRYAVHTFEKLFVPRSWVVLKED
ncbi:MAG: deoxyguanosinetriphosphate triphosphohydrolase [Acutalibacteraceae bacterium]|nr:deoxyguanosinetriphosphate triphosphohydrolase [Acutalibacteraceae bacterium]